MSEPNWLDQEPLFMCSNCYNEDYDQYVWYAEELRVLNDETWCRECYSNLPEGEEQVLWENLPPFVPKYLRKDN